MHNTILRPVTLEDAAWITARHATLYAQDDGFDDTFAPLVADILAGFFAHHDPRREKGWIAMRHDAAVGSIFCMDGQDDAAKLRLFLIERSERGTGLAQHMLETCLQFARTAGYPAIRLWTHESHRAAGRLYARNGFCLTASRNTRSFGQDLVAQTWERGL